ncbi:MAG: HEAT repeat domain-containing protein [Planctomycetes bacterium]|nr:HEAT repeat domain-containing protein [Planctomycetota bacterium]
MELLRYEGHKKEVMNDVVPALADLGEKRAAKPLASLLKNQVKIYDKPANGSSGELFARSDLRIEDVIIDALIRLDARDELLELLKADDFKLVSRAALALVKMKEPKVLMPLLKMFRENVSDDNGHDKCVFAIKCLGMLGDPKVIELLFKETAGKEHQIQYTAIMSMFRLDRQKAMKLLMPIFDEKLTSTKIEDESEIANIAGAIIRYGRAEDIKSVFGKIQKRSDSNLDFSISGGIGGDCSRLTTDIVIPYIESDSPGIRRWAAEILGNLGDVRAVGPLIKELKDEDYDVRVAAVVALGKLGDASVVTPIIEVFDGLSYDPGCIEAAGNFGDPRFTPFLLNALKAAISKEEHEQNGESGLVVEALGKTKNPAVVGDIIRSIEKASKADYDPYRYVGDALGALGNLRGNEAYEYLSNLPRFYKEWGPNSYLAAICAIGKLRDPRAIELLVKAINETPADLMPAVYKSPNGLSIRKAAIESIGQIGGPMAVDALVKFLDHGYLDVRLNAARALCIMNDPSAQPSLEKAAGDLHWQVRAYANAALYRFGDRSAIQPVLALLKTGDLKRRSTAFDILSLLKDRVYLHFLTEEFLNNPFGMYEHGFMYGRIEVSIIDAIVDMGGREALETMTKAEKKLCDEIEYYLMLHGIDDFMGTVGKYTRNLQEIRGAIIKIQRKMAAPATRTGKATHY